jgi:hypothetical protein
MVKAKVKAKVITKVKDSKRLVIDASVARSAGGNEATSAGSKHCRDFLKSVLEICHRIVMTSEMKREWDKHQSSFARQWRVSMVARKKVDYLDDAKNNTVSTLSNKVDLATVNKSDLKAMLKDFHLIESALASDRTIVSLDEAVRKLFIAASSSVGELKSIVWVNPAKEEEQPIFWLQDGAKAEKERQLGYRLEEE